ncbi:MAG: dUTP diphosphatase [Armatimonadetes bacterium]|nr:dUTP diphosphatase [Armatimonadota bacterium]
MVAAEPGARLPEYATANSAGMDLRAHISQPITIAPGERTLIPTGIRLAIPPGYEGQVRPRSGLAIRHGLTVLNSPGTIDADYRGEVKVVLANLGSEPVTIQPGDRIAQLVIAPVVRAFLVRVEELPESDRGEGGFGHTGVQ